MVWIASLAMDTREGFLGAGENGACEEVLDCSRGELECLEARERIVTGEMLGGLTEG